MGSMACLVGGDGDWSNLERIRAGEKIQVVRQDKKTVNGSFESFSAESLVVRQKSGALVIPKNEIVRVSATEQGHRMRNLAIGAAAGAGAGYLAGRAATNRWNGQTEFAVTFATLIGAGGGAGLGAAIPGYPTIYRANAKTRPAR